MTTDTGTTFDPTNLKYQANEEFLPDKESLWPHSKDVDAWVHAHNMIRADMKLFEECALALQSRPAVVVEAKNEAEEAKTEAAATTSEEKESTEPAAPAPTTAEPATTAPPPTTTAAAVLKEWEVQALTKVFDTQYLIVHAHHTNEDNILTPALMKRCKYPDKLTDDHSGIVSQLDKLKGLVHALQAGEECQTAMAPLVAEFQSFQPNMRAHLQEEEDIGLPLMRAYFEPEAYAKITAEIIQKSPQIELGSFIYHMGVDRFRSEFMKQENIPFFVWFLTFRGCWKLYERDVLTLANAIKSGVEPHTMGPFAFLHRRLRHQ